MCNLHISIIIIRSLSLWNPQAGVPQTEEPQSSILVIVIIITTFPCCKDLLNV